MILYIAELKKESIFYYGDRLLWKTSKRLHKILNSSKIDFLEFSEIQFLIIYLIDLLDEIKRRFLESNLGFVKRNRLSKYSKIPEFLFTLKGESDRFDPKKPRSYSKLPERSLEEKGILTIVKTLKYSKITTPAKHLNMEYFN